MPRILEIILASLGLIVLVPLILVLVVAVRYDSPGPGIFRQTRIGRYGHCFECYKLRTMAIETPHVPTHDARPGDLTRIGSFLRNAKLDELPQLFNVLVGEMSFVPRPSLESQTALIAEREMRGVLNIRPGITGMAQIRGIDMSDPILLAEVDADYMANRSFALDVEILFRTVFGGAGRGDRIGR